MKASIEVSDRKEAELIRAGLADPQTRALVKVIGALSGLTDRAKRRVLEYTRDRLDEQSEAPIE